MSSLSQFSSFGFAGSRRGVGVAHASRLLSSLPLSARLFATCGAGVPAVAANFLSTSVFRANSSRYSHMHRSAALVARASHFVRSLSNQAAPLLFVWPGCPCPPSLRPGLRSWQSVSSGSWSEFGLAVGLGCPAVVFGHKPAAHFAPVAFLSGWFCQGAPSLF